MSNSTRFNKKNAERVALLDDFDSDDDFFLKGPSSATDKVKRVQSQVREVVGVMQQNIEKVIERGDQLDDLQDKSENLAQSSTEFNARATRLRKQMWWKNCKVKLFVALFLLVIIAIIVLSVTLKHKKT